jgi:tetratricopeptide (TPR) repeat protein
VDACGLGHSLLESGDIDTATHWFEQAVALEPRNGSFYWNLVFSRSGQVGDATLEAMQRLAVEIDSLSVKQQIELQFALASAYESAGRYDDAFRWLQTGNTLKRRTIRYEEAATMRLFHALETTFMHLLASRALRNCGNPSTRPVFVFGMPRSGTTLVEQLLSAHPLISAAGELSLLERLMQDVFFPLLGGSELISAESMRSTIRTIGDRYLTETNAIAANARFTSDKQPHNFCFAPMIHLALPSARMIHVKRDWIDTCLSCYATLFADDSVTYSYDLGELARYYRAYVQMMSVWRKILPPGSILEVEYETLVADFENTARRIVAHCSLPWDERILEFHRVKRPVRTESRVQVRRPLYTSSVGRSRRFARHLPGLVDALTL